MDKGRSRNYLFATIWIIIDIHQYIIVGDIGFKRKPNENGEMEIGYSTQPAYQRKGYMNEAIGEMLSWAFKDSRVKAILAETREDNIPSIKVLNKNGFIDFKRENNMIWWKRKKINKFTSETISPA